MVRLHITLLRSCLLRMWRRVSLQLGFFVVLAAPLPGHALEPVAEFGPNPGNLAMFVHAPADLPEMAPLVIALHGCTQSAKAFDDETGLLALADRHGFALVFAEQSEDNNPTACFNWFADSDNRRDVGESASIRAMVAEATARFGSDPDRIFVLGLSAGGSMTAVMLATYPEVFRAGAVIAGSPYGCNRPDVWTWAWWTWLKTWVGDAAAAAYACGLLNSQPISRSAREWGDIVRGLDGQSVDRWPRLSLWQGDADRVVDPDNHRELVKQWTDLHAIDADPDGVETHGTATRTLYRDDRDEILIEAWMIPDFEHAIAIDPDGAPISCGIVAEFIEDADICTVARIIDFWEITR